MRNKRKRSRKPAKGSSVSVGVGAVVGVSVGLGVSVGSEVAVAVGGSVAVGDKVGSGEGMGVALLLHAVTISRQINTNNANEDLCFFMMTNSG